MVLVEGLKDAQDERIRAALVAAARKVVETEGFVALTLASAAKAAGVDNDVVDQHFSSRTALVHAVYRDFTEDDDLAESFDLIWLNLDAASALIDWARHISRAHPSTTVIATAIQRARHDDPDAAEVWNLAARDWYGSCARLAEWLESENALKSKWDVTTAADMLWGLTSWDLLDRLIADRGWPAHRFGDHLAGLLTTTLLRADQIPAF